MGNKIIGYDTLEEYLASDKILGDMVVEAFKLAGVDTAAVERLRANQITIIESHMALQERNEKLRRSEFSLKRELIDMKNGLKALLGLRK